MADLIDRSALGISYADKSRFIEPAYARGWNSAIRIIMNAPTVDAPAIEEGEWIRPSYHCTTNGDANVVTDYTSYECSHCGAALRNVYHKATPFCPYCGKPMKNGGEKRGRKKDGESVHES